jgi:hypothetical protein
MFFNGGFQFLGDVLNLYFHSQEVACFFALLGFIWVLGLLAL